jgi:hypothetical protein
MQIAFKATNVELGDEEQEGNDDRNLCRFEFIEMLIRLGKQKYLDPGIVSTIGQAFQEMVKLMILPSIDNPHRWQSFRNEQLWTLAANDMFETNIDALKKLFKLACGGKTKKILTREQALFFLTKTCETQLKLSTQQA